MHEKLIKSLRACAENSTTRVCFTCPWALHQKGCISAMVTAAADAIEEQEADKADLYGTVTNLLEQIKDIARPCWIPVTERLPEDEKDVLAYYGFVHDGEMSEIRFIGAVEYFAFDTPPHWQHESTGLTVTHWMPLPQPPTDCRQMVTDSNQVQEEE